MKYLIPFLLCFILFSCSVPNQVNKSALKGISYPGKFAKFLEEGEQEINTNYYQMLSRLPDGRYKFRTFFPETQQLVQERTYSDAKLKILDGPAKKWKDNGSPLEVGQYQNNLKTGLWINYSLLHEKTSLKGHYQDDQKIGSWERFDTKGRLIEKIEYQAGMKQGAFIRYDSLGTITNQGEFRMDTLYQQSQAIKKPTKEVVEEMPYLSVCKTISDKKERNKCSSIKLLEHVYGDMRYPRVARENFVEGLAILRFVITKEGKVEDIVVQRGICESISAECLRVARNLPSWEPGTQDGKAVNVSYLLPIKFKLE